MNRAITLRARFLSLALLALLAACGGGGGDETPAPTAGAPTPSPSPIPAPSPSPSPAPGADVTCGLAGYQAEMLSRVNAYRAAGASCGANGSFPAAPALAWNAALTEAGRVHSQDMVTHNFFSHTGSDGSDAGQRITAAGYAWHGWGENIAAGYGTVQQVVDGWMASDGHCANIMNASLKDIGVACLRGTASNAYSTYWTMDLARP
ncbi:MAG: CAP domain-containing protein [Rubrivivax sp.]